MENVNLIIQRFKKNGVAKPLQKVSTKTKSVLRDTLKLKEINEQTMDYLLIKRPQLGRWRMFQDEQL